MSSTSAAAFEPPREHHFYVSIAKFLFWHPEFGIVSVMDPIRIADAKTYGLSAIILYGLTVPGLPVRWMTFTPADRPRALRDVLQEAWHDAEGLRGRPNILRISRHVAMATPGLVAEMAGIGVRVEIADSGNKSLPASLRSAQNESKWIIRNRDGTAPNLPDSIPALCRDAREEHLFMVRNRDSLAHGHAVADKMKRWLALPVQKPVSMLPRGMDWEPGPWLQSWESRLPPHRDRYFTFGSTSPLGSETWLLTDEEESEDLIGEEFHDNWAFDNSAEVIRDFVDCWPNPPAEIASCAGITLQELKWFTSGKASLDLKVRLELEALLGIELHEFRRFYHGTGPCALLGRKPKAIMNAYDSIAVGGDSSPCELVPRQGLADPSWRYVLINPHSEPPSIAMFPRGERITDRIETLLLNYSGISEVPAALYRDVVSTCARASRDPAANLREMKKFANRHRDRWAEGIWLPE